MNKIVNSVEELLGNTPMIKLNRFFKNQNVYAKLEYFNPSLSIKDRAAFYMVQQKIKENLIKEGDTIIEATSGNTGLGLCIASIVYNLKFIAVVFDDVSEEKINMLKGYGATVIICNSELNSNRKGGYVWVAKKIAEIFSDIHFIDQFNNHHNPLAHYENTGPEIWEQLNGNIDIFINTIGTGGTITGISQFLKEKNPEIRTIGVEPIGGIYKSYFEGKEMNYKDHLIHSISDNFISGNFKKELIDDVVQISDKESFSTCINVMKIEGICIGTSGGCTISAIKKYINENNIPKNTNIVCTIADSGIKYANTMMNLKYLNTNNLDYECLSKYPTEDEEIKKVLKDLNVEVEVK